MYKHFVCPVCFALYNDDHCRRVVDEWNSYCQIHMFLFTFRQYVKVQVTYLASDSLGVTGFTRESHSVGDWVCNRPTVIVVLYQNQCLYKEGLLVESPFFQKFPKPKIFSLRGNKVHVEYETLLHG